MIRIGLGSSVATLMLALAQPAVAGDVGVIQSTQSTTAPSWTGAFIGVDAGFGSGDIGYVLGNPPELGLTDLDYDFSERSGIVGAHLGYDAQLSDRIVTGIEAGVSTENASISPFDVGGFGTLFTATTTVGISGRAGVLVDPRTLVYGRLGLDLVNYRAEQGVDERTNDWVPNTRLGVGIEAMLGKGLSGRVEVSRETNNETYEVPGDFEFFDPHFLNVSAGLSYRFGEGESDPTYSSAGGSTDWTGFYAGVSGSYQVARIDRAIETPGAAVGPFADEIPSGGVFFGGDYALGTGVVLGGQVEATTLNAQFYDPAFNELTPDAPSLFATVDGELAATIRIGYLVSPTTMFYGKAGFAVLDTKANPEFFALDEGEDGQAWLQAATFGMGVETSLTDKLSIRVEGDFTQATQSVTTNSTQTGQVSLTPSLTTGTVGLAYRF